jgi:hypothetical protein
MFAAVEIPVDDIGVVSDIDTVADLQRVAGLMESISS